MMTAMDPYVASFVGDEWVQGLDHLGRQHHSSLYKTIQIYLHLVHVRYTKLVDRVCMR